MENNADNVSLLEMPELAGLIASTLVVEHAAGEVLFQSGEPCNSLPLLKSGNATIYARDKTGRQVALYCLKPGADHLPYTTHRRAFLPERYVPFSTYNARQIRDCYRSGNTVILSNKSDIKITVKRASRCELGFTLGSSRVRTSYATH